MVLWRHSCSRCCTLLQDAAAAKAISHRGVLLVGAAHGSSLGSLLRNTELSGLVGGVTSATRDEQARASKGGSKVGGGEQEECLGVS